MSDSRAAANQEPRTKNQELRTKNQELSKPKPNKHYENKKNPSTPHFRGIRNNHGFSGGGDHDALRPQCRRPVSACVRHLNHDHATSSDINTYNTFVNNLATHRRPGHHCGHRGGNYHMDSNRALHRQSMSRDNTSTTGAGTGIGIYLLNDTAIATVTQICGMEPSPTSSRLTSRGTADPMPTARCGREPMVTDQQAMTLSVPQHQSLVRLISPALIRG